MSSRWLEIIPVVDFEESDGEGTHYVAIGSVGGNAEDGWTVFNFRFGPIAAYLCGELVTWY